MGYIDALLFAAGGCTQSGLNPIDLNKLRTFQQIIVYLLPQLTNPIVINTFVVFLRLYWFEKRFQHIAKEAKKHRRSISKTRSQMKGDRDLGAEERGVGGRTIKVLHQSPGHSMSRSRDQTEAGSHGKANGNNDEFAITFEKDDTVSKPPLKSHPTIKFANQVKRSDGLEDATRMPRFDNDQHIAVLERQRKYNSDDGVLRIPGPRDAERGVAPETVDEDAPDSPTTNRGNTFGRKAERELSPLEEDSSLEPQESKIEGAEESAMAAVHTLNLFKRWHFQQPPKAAGTDESEDPAASKPKRRMSFANIRSALTRDKEEDPMPYISFQPTIGRNSAFVDLTEEQREELGGIEYRSLKSLAAVLVGYYWFWTLLSYISLTPWILRSGTFGEIVDAAGVSRTWWAFFTGTSAFNDLGFTLTPDSMVSFQTAIWPLFLMSFLIIFGNTGFPIMLRWIILAISKLVPKGSGIWEETRFLLDHPRRCFTLLFPSNATWWLFGILVILNGVDLLFFIILDFGNPVVEALRPNIRVLAGWFQATSTRTAGFAVVNIAELHPAVQISYMIMMYISIFPIAISVRRTNVYEEQSLGIWSADENENDAEASYVGSHIRRQLSFDLWFVTLGWFIMAIAEGGKLQDADKPAFNLFSCLFEIISAYGTVGLSLGYPDTNTSFLAQFSVVGKLVIIAMMIRGRHRGLPYELDRAILLPSESLHQREVAEAAARKRMNSLATQSPGADNNAQASGAELQHVATSGEDAAAMSGMTQRKREKSTANFISSILHPGPPAVRRYSNIRKMGDETLMKRVGTQELARFEDTALGRRLGEADAQMTGARSHDDSEYDEVEKVRRANTNIAGSGPGPRRRGLGQGVIGRGRVVKDGEEGGGVLKKVFSI